MLQLGRGAPVNLAESAKWYQKAADRGDPVAATYLASLMEAGSGVPQDRSGAISLYQQAAGAGEVQAMTRLGILLSRSHPVEARRWLDRAAADGDPTAQRLLRGE